ncbi:uncharacterized protein LOC142337161 [Convolutriloba macropyga]|uniref:uncharacterized protein LOC142337161 n=1 Tax=Convolutriloba macropyga TaxID=536237 RepID=UPI003F522537
MTSSVTSNLLTFLVPNMQRREDVSTVEGYPSPTTSTQDGFLISTTNVTTTPGFQMQALIQDYDYYLDYFWEKEVGRLDNDMPVKYTFVLCCVLIPLFIMVAFVLAAVIVVLKYFYGKRKRASEVENLSMEKRPDESNKRSRKPRRGSKDLLPTKEN